MILCDMRGFLSIYDKVLKSMSPVQIKPHDWRWKKEKKRQSEYYRMLTAIECWLHEPLLLSVLIHADKSSSQYLEKIQFWNFQIFEFLSDFSNILLTALRTEHKLWLPLQVYKSYLQGTKNSSKDIKLHSLLANTFSLLDTFSKVIQHL